MLNCIHSVIETSDASQILDTARINVFINDLPNFELKADELPDIMVKMLGKTLPTSYLILKVNLFIKQDEQLYTDCIDMNIVAFDGITVAEWVYTFDPQTGDVVEYHIRKGSAL